MFDSLEERIKSDERKMASSRERMFRWAIVAVVSVLVFGGLYLAVYFMQS